MSSKSSGWTLNPFLPKRIPPFFELPIHTFIHESSYHQPSPMYSAVSILLATLPPRFAGPTRILSSFGDFRLLVLRLLLLLLKRSLRATNQNFSLSSNQLDLVYSTSQVQDQRLSEKRNTDSEEMSKGRFNILTRAHIQHADSNSTLIPYCELWFYISSVIEPELTALTMSQGDTRIGFGHARTTLEVVLISTKSTGLIEEGCTTLV